MFKSSSNVIYVKLPDDEYEYVLKEVNRRKMTLKGWMQQVIRDLKNKDAPNGDDKGI